VNDLTTSFLLLSFSLLELSSLFPSCFFFWPHNILRPVVSITASIVVKLFPVKDKFRILNGLQAEDLIRRFRLRLGAPTHQSEKVNYGYW
jgi:hypothetical protein